MVRDQDRVVQPAVLPRALVGTGGKAGRQGLGGSGRIDLGSEPAPRPKRGGTRLSPVAVGAAPGDTINTGDGYRTDPRTTWISAPGCYAFQVDGLGFSELIVFQARAPAK